MRPHSLQNHKNKNALRSPYKTPEERLVQMALLYRFNLPTDPFINIDKFSEKDQLRALYFYWHHTENLSAIVNHTIVTGQGVNFFNARPMYAFAPDAPTFLIERTLISLAKFKTEIGQLMETLEANYLRPTCPANTTTTPQIAPPASRAGGGAVAYTTQLAESDGGLMKRDYPERSL